MCLVELGFIHHPSLTQGACARSSIATVGSCDGHSPILLDPTRANTLGTGIDLCGTTGFHLMPIYEYHCDTCDQTFEKLQKMSDAPLQVHEDCGGKLEKLTSASAIRFNGAGFYVNDYGKNRVTTKRLGSTDKPS
jgi:putative FmdB family regulatory protein